MSNQNMRYRGWCPSNEYQVHEVTWPALRKRSDHPQHQKGHVAFRTNLEEEEEEEEEKANPLPVAVTDTEIPTTSTTNRSKVFVSVDQKADAFIKSEHRRIELARLKSLGVN